MLIINQMSCTYILRNSCELVLNVSRMSRLNRSLSTWCTYNTLDIVLQSAILSWISWLRRIRSLRCWCKCFWGWIRTQILLSLKIWLNITITLNNLSNRYRSCKSILLNKSIAWISTIKITSQILTSLIQYLLIADIRLIGKLIDCCIGFLQICCTHVEQLMFIDIFIYYSDKFLFIYSSITENNLFIFTAFLFINIHVYFNLTAYFIYLFISYTNQNPKIISDIKQKKQHIKLYKMNRSRTRQFNQFRNVGGNNSSVRSQANSMHSSKISQSTVNEACVNCVNQIMADRHKKAEKQIKQKQKLDFKKNIEAMNSMMDTQNRYRQSLKKDALNHNSRMIQQKKHTKVHEKQQDHKYAQEMQKKIEQAEKNMKSQLIAQKQKQNQYYQHIHDQYLNQMQKKDRERLHKQDDDVKSEGLPLYNQNLAQQRQVYKKQLQRQMEQKKRRQNEQKVRNQIRQRQLLEESKKESDKYHADNYEALKMSKQQVFGGLKNLQIQKKRRAQEERKRGQQSRLRQIKQDNEYRSKAIKFKMEQMHKYVNGLKNQLLEKQEKLRMSKVTQSKFIEKYPKSTEQAHAQNEIKKTCKSCQKDYPQEFISPVPRKL